MRAIGIALVMAVSLGLTSASGLGEPRAAQPIATPAAVLLINQDNAAFPAAGAIRGEQVLMLLRHFDPSAVLVEDDDYRAGTAEAFERVVVLGNDASRPIAPAVLADLQHRTRPTMWIGYGLGLLSADPDRDFGFAPGFVTTADVSTAPVTVTYQRRSYPSALEDYHRIRIARPDVEVLTSVRDRGEEVPLAVRGGDLWFFGTLPGFDTDYPDPGIDAPNLVFADLLHRFFGQAEHDAPQAIVRLEDVSVHIAPSRIIDAVDTLASRGVPFVLGVIPAQRLADGSVLSLADRPDFVQALRYAQDRGGTIALHGYHHTFGQGEDFEFWDPARDAPPESERSETVALKVEAGIRSLRDQGLEPLLWETPHYAASGLGYAVFARYFSHAIENRDPVSWMPYPAGPDPAGQVLIPENIGYINESDGLTVDAQLARADLLRIVRDATAVGFYHPATIPVADLARLVDGLAALGYRFADVRAMGLHVDATYHPSTMASAAAFLRIEPGLTLLEIRQALVRAVVPIKGLGSGPTWFALMVLAVGVFLVRLRAQWRPAAATRSRVDGEMGPVRTRFIERSGLAAVAVVVLAGAWRVTLLGPVGPVPTERISAEAAVGAEVSPVASTGWAVSAYFTAVEQYYTGPMVQLRGCPVIDCAAGTADLGRHPRDFLEAVKAEGSGRLASPIGGSWYLDWSIDVGYWLDTAPRDARGSILQAYVSAAADPAIAYVSTFRIDRCGRDVRTGEAMEPATCAAIRDATWIVRDRFTAGAVGKHLDLYIGEQDRVDFLATSPRAIDTEGAAISLHAYDTQGWASR